MVGRHDLQMRDREAERSADEDATAPRKTSESADQVQRGVLQKKASDRNQDLLHRISRQAERLQGDSSQEGRGIRSADEAGSSEAPSIDCDANFPERKLKAAAIGRSDGSGLYCGDAQRARGLSRDETPGRPRINQEVEGELAGPLLRMTQSNLDGEGAHGSYPDPSVTCGPLRLGRRTWRFTRFTYLGSRKAFVG